MDITYDEVDAGVIGAPKDVVIDDDEVAGNGVAFVDNVLVHTFLVVNGYGQRRQLGDVAH